MSRIGQQAIAVPDGVKVAEQKGRVTVEGPQGKLDYELPDGIGMEHDAEKKEIRLSRASDSKPHRELHGLARSLVRNMVVGVSEGYRKSLEVIGIGYNVKLEGSNVALQVGLANTVILPVPAGIKVNVEQATNPGKLTVSGCDKQMVGEFAARIRAARPPEPYQGKGVRYADEQVRRKAGKAFVGAGG